MSRRERRPRRPDRSRSSLRACSSSARPIRRGREVDPAGATEYRRANNASGPACANTRPVASGSVSRGRIRGQAIAQVVPRIEEED
jgi:hypothetical protein